MLGSMMFEGGDIIRERIQRYQIQCDYARAACSWR
jgi:gamma-glutamylputrescine oxidase